MLDKFVCCPEETAPDGTRYNDPPIGLRRISEKEFAQSKFFSQVPTHREYRQIFVDDNLQKPEKRNLSKMVSIYLYWFADKTGIAMHSDYLKGKIEYFAFGCEHKYHELSQEEANGRGIKHWGMCYHIEECEKCKHINAYDSSD